MARLTERFYYESKAKRATVRLSQLNKEQRESVFRYYDEVYSQFTLGAMMGRDNPHRRQEYCEQMIQVHGTKARLLEFLEEVGYL